MSIEVALQVLVPFIGGLLGLLILLLGWIGSKLHQRLEIINDTLETRLDSIYSSLNMIERDLRGELVTLDRRITRVEARFSIYHDDKNSRDIHE
jgi:hypothetical protein